MKIQYKILPIMMVLLVLPALPLLARDDSPGKASPERERKEHRACEEDARRLCPNVKPGDGRIAACLRQHKAEMSAACKADHERAREKAEHRRDHNRKACEGDVQKHCKGVEPGDGRIVHCLKEHKTQLSEACRASLNHKRPRADGETRNERR